MKKKRTPGERYSISIEGKPVLVTYVELPIEQVKLDPNNPRFKYQLGRQTRGKPTQKEIKAFLFDLPDVRQDLFVRIRNHGGLIHPIVVTTEGVVVEGNCRVAVYAELHARRSTEKQWEKIPAHILPGNVTPRQVAILQAEEHVSGKIMWRPYEQAGHIHFMKTVLSMELESIASALGKKVGLIERLLEAYNDMSIHYLPTTKERSAIRAWSYFEEFHKRKDLAEFRKVSDNRTKFAQWVRDDKFPKGADVRDLSSILKDPVARKRFEAEGHKAAINEVRKVDPTKASPLFQQVRRTTNMLNNLKAAILEEIRQHPAAQEELRNLYGALKKIADAVKLDLS